MASDPAVWATVPARELEGRKVFLGVFLEELRENLILSPILFGVESEPGLHLLYTHGPDPDWVPAGKHAHSTALRKLEQVRRIVVSLTPDGDRPGLGLVHAVASNLERQIAGWMAPEGLAGPDVLYKRYLATFLHDDRKLFGAVRYVFRMPVIDRGFGRRTVPRGGRPDSRELELVPGLTAALADAWIACLGDGDLAARIRVARDFAAIDDLSRAAEDRVGQMTWPAVEDVEWSGGPAQTWWTDAPEVVADQRDKWNTVFDGRPVRVLADGDCLRAYSALDWFAGAASLERRGSPRMIIFRHGDNGFGEGFSYAIWLPASGTFFSEASEYWLLYNVGGGDEMAGLQVQKKAEDVARLLRKVGTVDEFIIDDEDAFKAYLKPISQVRRKNQLEGLRRMVSALRGYSAELMASHLLSREGYKVLGVRRRLRWLRDEADVVAHRDGEVLFVECKSQLRLSPFSEEFSDSNGSGWEASQEMQDVEVFARRLEGRRDFAELATELRLPQVSTVTGAVFVLGDVDDEARAVLAERVQICSLEDLRPRLQKAGLRSRELDEIARGPGLLHDIDQALNEGERDSLDPGTNRR